MERIYYLRLKNLWTHQPIYPRQLQMRKLNKSGFQVQRSAKTDRLVRYRLSLVNRPRNQLLSLQTTTQQSKVRNLVKIIKS